jgi:Transmembrane exosortase (Exosortase_EpsH).
VGRTMATLATSPAKGATRRESGWPRAWIVAIGVLWLPFLWRLTPAWSSSVEQAYGWAVPLLALYLALERARWAPERRAGETGGGRRIGRVVLWVVLGGALAVLPLLWTILEANGMWPLVQWAAFGAVAAATLALIALDGGVRRAGHFVFPVLFVATALTWPAAVTMRLVAALVGMNAQLAANVVSMLGHPAVVRGSVIEVATGFVGIDEACSGLRSLQAVWMAGWFFGELFHLGRVRRCGLAASAVLVAVVGNLIRTTALTWLAAADSPAASARWHDNAGGLEMAGTLLAVAVLAWCWGGRTARRPAETRGAVSPARSVAAWRVAVAAGLVAAATPVAWFGWHEAEARSRTQWELVRPGEDWEDYEFPKRAKELLRASTTAGLMRREAGMDRSFALLVKWEGESVTALSAEVHDPSICLPAAGLGPPLSVEPATLEIGGVSVTFEVARVEARARRWHVFYCHWDAWLGRPRGAENEVVASLPRWRLERVWEGRRRGDAAYLALVAPEADEWAAREWLREWAPRLFAPQ